MQHTETSTTVDPLADFKGQLFRIGRFKMLAKLEEEMSSPEQIRRHHDVITTVLVGTIKCLARDVGEHPEMTALEGLLKALRLLQEAYIGLGIAERGFVGGQLRVLFENEDIDWTRPELSASRVWMLEEMAREWLHGFEDAVSGAEEIGKLLLRTAVADDVTCRQEDCSLALKRATSKDCSTHVLLSALRWMADVGAQVLQRHCRASVVQERIEAVFDHALSRNATAFVSASLRLTAPLYGAYRPSGHVLQYMEPFLRYQIRAGLPFGVLAADLEYRLGMALGDGNTVTVEHAALPLGRIGTLRVVRAVHVADKELIDGASAKGDAGAFMQSILDREKHRLVDAVNAWLSGPRGILPPDVLPAKRFAQLRVVTVVQSESNGQVVAETFMNEL